MPADLALQNPFALLTLIVAPAVLTNAMSVLALSTSNRFLRAGERLRTLDHEIQATSDPEEKRWRLVHVGRIEKQAVLLLSALRGAYVALGAFISATLISVLGAGLASRQWHPADEIMVVLAFAAGTTGAASIVFACVKLFRATRLSMMNIAEEAAVIRTRTKL